MAILDEPIRQVIALNNYIKVGKVLVRIHSGAGRGKSHHPKDNTAAQSNPKRLKTARLEKFKTLTSGVTR